MIYLDNTTERQQTRIPWVGIIPEETEGWGTLKIWSTTDAGTVYDAEWNDSVIEDALYVKGSLKLPAGLPDGEYEYRLELNGQVLGSGVCQIGQYEAVPVQKSDTTITFKQYERRN